MIFRSSANKQEKVVIYAYPANSDTFNEAILLINTHDRQLTIFQLLGEFSMDDVNDIKDEINDDTNGDGDDVIVIDAKQQ